MKKNDKTYLLDLKIDIRAEKDINYQELSLLFDKPTFLNLLPLLRAEYQVVNPIPTNEYQDYLENVVCGEHGFEQVKINLGKYSKLAQLKKDIPDFYAVLQDRIEYPIALDNECYLLCYIFNRPLHFVDVIRQAIFCSAVTEDLFNPTKATLIDPSEMWVGATLPPIAIFVSPTSTYEDVKEEFRKAKELMKTDQRLSYYQPRTDMTPNIRRYREWYWQWIIGTKHQKIANEWLENHLDDESDTTTYTTVYKAVKAYQKLLSI